MNEGHVKRSGIRIEAQQVPTIALLLLEHYKDRLHETVGKHVMLKGELVLRMPSTQSS